MPMDSELKHDETGQTSTHRRVPARGGQAAFKIRIGVAEVARSLAYSAVRLSAGVTGCTGYERMGGAYGSRRVARELAAEECECVSFRDSA